MEAYNKILHIFQLWGTIHISECVDRFKDDRVHLAKLIDEYELYKIKHTDYLST